MSRPPHRRALEGGVDRRHHLVQPRDHVVVRHPYDAEPRSGEDGFALGVLLGAAVVASSVDLDDEADVAGVEVYDVRADGLLPPELDAELVTAEAGPEEALRERGVAAEPAGADDAVRGVGEVRHAEVPARVG